MIFETTAVESTMGALLAHSIRTQTTIFKKGRVLSNDDIAALKQAGIRELTIARLEPTDVPEDEAARDLAQITAGAHVTSSEPFTGRANLYADRQGLVIVKRNVVDELNAIDESLTLATLPPFSMVIRRQLLATIKIIPFAVSRNVFTRATVVAKEAGPAISVAPFETKNIGLICTRLPDTKSSIVEKTKKVIQSRIERLGCRLHYDVACDHQHDEISSAMRKTLATGCDIVLIFGASAIVDRRDAIPRGIIEAGGKVRHFGMPVDPGNLLLLGQIDAKPVVGLPGCARSPKENGFDWILSRLVANIDVGPNEIAAMGVGGLLKEIPSRPQPRNEYVHNHTNNPPSAPRISAIVLAAGESRRTGGMNKLLADINGTPMVRLVTEAALASQADETLVVIGHESDKLRKALSNLPVRFVTNSKFKLGLSTSLRAGIAAMDSEADGVLVCLGDMPGVSSKHIDKLIAAFDPDEGRSICVPTHKGKRGNPVLWGRQLFEKLDHVTGDVGAKHLISKNLDFVYEVEMSGDTGVLDDVDTLEALDAFRRKI